MISSVREGDQKPGVGNRLHLREEPFRDERPGAPLMVPARRMNRGGFLSFRARSRWSRTIALFGMPVSRLTLSSHCSSSSVRRIVSV
jgi:hypothetical protein